MDLTVFQYITEIPEVIDNTVWFTLAARAYNLGLTCVWLFIILYLMETIFKSLSRFYKRGA